MGKSKLRKLRVSIFLTVVCFFSWTLPVFAVSESDVQNAVASQGKETVSGNLFVWFLCAIAFLNVSTKIDSILQAMGLGVGRAPGSLLAEAFMALRGLQAGIAVMTGKMPASGGKPGKTPSPGPLSDGLAGAVSQKLETDTAAVMSGTSDGGFTAGLGASLYRNTLGQDGGCASRVIGSVATGQTAGFIQGEAASEAMQGYFAGTPDPNPGTEALDPSGDGLGSIPASADAGYDAAPTEAPIPTSPMALENDTAVQVSPGY